MHEQLLDILEKLAPTLPSDKLVQVAKVLFPLLARDEPEPPKRISRPRPRDVKRPKVGAAKARKAIGRASNGHAAPNGAGAARGDRVHAAENFLRQALQKGPATASEVEAESRRQMISPNVSVGRGHGSGSLPRRTAPRRSGPFQRRPNAAGHQRAIALNVVRILDSMHVDLLNEETARRLNDHRRRHPSRRAASSLCRAAADRLPVASAPAPDPSPVLQPRAPERTSHLVQRRAG